MILHTRVTMLSTIFDALQSTTSLNEKRAIVDTVPAELREDFDFILEVLDGKHKFGYTYLTGFSGCTNKPKFATVKQILQFLLEPARTGDLTNLNVTNHIWRVAEYDDFLEPIVNRTLRLGIGKSVLPQDGLAPMLAKAYDPGKIPFSKQYFVTQKLDGNRCIAVYDGNKWNFISRNGKPMKVDFSMAGLPTQYVYDGEVLSPEQTLHLRNVTYSVAHTTIEGQKAALNHKYGAEAFNKTSGLINQKGTGKALVYNIFDIMQDNLTYVERRDILDQLPTASDVNIVPVLAKYDSKEDMQNDVHDLLDYVVEIGAEGLMINASSAKYNHKRTNDLIKLKQVQTMDMLVTGIEEGKGKYEGQVGALICEAITPTMTICCNVGSGLSDWQRHHYAHFPNEIIGSIVEVAYFEKTPDGSLRFPRLKRVRFDKTTTSVD